MTFVKLLTASLLSVALPLAALAQEGENARHGDGADANNPHACAHVWQEIGLPVSHKGQLENEGDPEDRQNENDRVDSDIQQNAAEVIKSPTIVCREHFITQYNSFTKNPDWVIERLTREIVEGMNTRPSVGFKRDPKLPQGVLSAVDKDYRGSGLARGHQAASADFKSNLEWMKETFVFSNAVPQVQNGFNGGIWKELEEHVQDFAKSLDEEEAIYVITGPIDLPVDGSETIIAADQNGCLNELRLAGLEKLRKRDICDENDQHASHKCTHGVAVPAALFKIIYVPFLERAFGFLMSNEDHRKIKSRGISNTDYFEKWRATVDVIEDASNLNFFPGKSRRWRNIHEQTCPVTRWRQ